MDQGGGIENGYFEEPKGGPMDIREEYSKITISGWEKYWPPGLMIWYKMPSNNKLIEYKAVDVLQVNS